MDWEALGYPGDPIEWGGRFEQQVAGCGEDYSKCFRHYTSDFLFNGCSSRWPCGCRRSAWPLACAALAAADPAQATHGRRRRRCTRPFALLDADGNNVLASGQAVSTMQTCGALPRHDLYRAAQLPRRSGPDRLWSRRALTLAQPWDQSRGVFGKWDPLTYRYLSPAGAERHDLTTAEWLLTARGARARRRPGHHGARRRQPLLNLRRDAANPETSILERPWRTDSLGLAEVGRDGDELLPLPPGQPRYTGARRRDRSRQVWLGQHGHAAGHRHRYADRTARRLCLAAGTPLTPTAS